MITIGWLRERIRPGDGGRAGHARSALVHVLGWLLVEAPRAGIAASKHPWAPRIARRASSAAPRLGALAKPPRQPCATIALISAPISAPRPKSATGSDGYPRRPRSIARSAVDAGMGQAAW